MFLICIFLITNAVDRVFLKNRITCFTSLKYLFDFSHQSRILVVSLCAGDSKRHSLGYSRRNNCRHRVAEFRSSGPWGFRIVLPLDRRQVILLAWATLNTGLGQVSAGISAQSQLIIGMKTI